MLGGEEAKDPEYRNWSVLAFTRPLHCISLNTSRYIKEKVTELSMLQDLSGRRCK